MIPETEVHVSGRRKWAIRIGICGLALLAALFTAGLALSLRANALLGAELQKIRDAGDTVAIADLVPPPVANADNAAVPVEKAISLVAAPGETEAAALAALEHDPAGCAAELADAAKAWLDRNSEAAALAERAFGLDRCRFDLDYSNPITMRLPHLSGLRNLWRLMGVKALLEARAGRTDSAFVGVAACIRAAAVCFEEPILIMQMIRVAIVNMQMDRLGSLLDMAAPGPDAEARLIAAMDAINLRKGLAAAMKGERCCGVFAFDSIRKEGGKTIRMVSSLESSENGPLSPVVYALAPRFLLKFDEVHYLRSSQKLIDAASRPAFETMDARKAGEITGKLPWYSLMTGMMLPSLERCISSSEACVARLALARTALALMAARTPEGGFPANLDSLVPQRMKSVPMDPFSGKTLLYKRDGDGSCTVYSTGADGVDDGGKALERAADEGGDIAWKLGR